MAVDMYSTLGWNNKRHLCLLHVLTFISLSRPLPLSFHLLLVLSICLTLWATSPLSFLTLPSTFSSPLSLSAPYLRFSSPLLNHVWLLTSRIKSSGSHAMLFIRALHKGWLWVFWSVAGQLWRSHTVRQPVLLTLVWWSNFPLRLEQPNEPNTSADTDKELCLLCDSVREVMTW